MPKTPGNNAQTWTMTIRPTRGLLELPLREVWAYRDLLLLLVRRDFVAMYKQTILGPLWFGIQPILTALVFTVVFGNIANISTDGLPHTLFYLAGITCWTFFADSLTKTSETFTQNAAIFGKVYFPRLIVPLSIILSNLMKFALQFLIFLAFVAYFMVSGSDVGPTPAVLLLPLLIVLMGGIGLALGMIISSMTTKYRDLRFLMVFAVQLFMYATPVIYPVSAIPEAYRPYIMANPITPIVEAFRAAFLGTGELSVGGLGYSAICMVVLLAGATLVFNQVEKNFMDTV